MSTYETTGISSSPRLREQYLYGSSRMGVLEKGTRSYELTDHLGNVRTEVNELKEVKAAYEYYAFGMSLAKIDNGYRYGFNGQEREIDLTGSTTSAEYWMYDGRLGRRWNIDPKLEEWSSPYSAFGNCPIKLTDPDGDFSRGDKTTSLSSFIKTLKAWEVEAVKHKKRTTDCMVGPCHVEDENTAKLRIFNADWQANTQIVNKVNNKPFSYNNDFGKYIDAGLPIDVQHFFKNAELSSYLPDGLVKKAGIHEETKQAFDKRDNGRTSAFAPEDLFSNYLGIYFGDALSKESIFSEELDKFLKEAKTLFTTGELKDGQYLTKEKIDELKSLAKKYYGTEDLTSFQKTNERYTLKEIKKVNAEQKNNASWLYKAYYSVKGWFTDDPDDKKSEKKK